MIKKIKLFVITKFYKIRFKEKVKIKPKFDQINRASKHKIIKLSFGEKNKNKNFFVIKRTPGAGFFSNFLYVLKYIHFALNKNYIPYVDMQNFPTNYNQIKNLNNIKNVWELYFEKISNVKLEDIYNSKNVYFSKTKFKTGIKDYENLKLKKLYFSKIKINKKIYRNANNFFEKNFKKKFAVGIHLRGTDQKITPGHHLPPTIYDLQILIDSIIKEKKNFKFFLLTEQKKYHKFLTKKYGKFICTYPVFRADKISDFNVNNRKNHRNRLAIESLTEALILSKCNKLIYCKSNIPLFSIFISRNKIQKVLLDNGINSKNPMYAFFKWYLTVLPISFLKYIFYKIFINR